MEDCAFCNYLADNFDRLSGFFSSDEVALSLALLCEGQKPLSSVPLDPEERVSKYRALPYFVYEKSEENEQKNQENIDSIKRASTLLARKLGF